MERHELESVNSEGVSPPRAPLFSEKQALRVWPFGIDPLGFAGKSGC